MAENKFSLLVASDGYFSYSVNQPQYMGFTEQHSNLEIKKNHVNISLGINTPTVLLSSLLPVSYVTNV